jgi:proline iminopeptidase
MTPDEFTICEQFLDVGDGHQLYIHDWGKKDAKTPIIFLHGGPGGSCDDGSKDYFDPTLQRVVFFDQRGCGQSKPFGELERNTTQESIEDITKIVSKLEIKEFILAGGSWGSCLALAYALANPKPVKAMALRGIFTGSQAEIDWIDKGHFKSFYPEVWQDYLDRTPKVHQTNPSKYHFKQIFGEDYEALKKSAYAYGMMESALLWLDNRFTPEDFENYNPYGARIEMYYLANSCFLPDQYILKNASKLKMPIHIIQGKYDVICPPETAYELHKNLPISQLYWTIAGHAGSDRANFDMFKSILLQLAN